MTDKQAAADGPIIAESWSAEYIATGRLALPIALTQLATIGMNVTDTVMLGWLGADVLAAGALGFRLYLTCFLFAMGVVSAVGPIVAQEIGAGHTRNVRRSLRQGFWVTLSVSAPLMVVIWHAEAILVAFGQPPAVSASAEIFSRALVWGLPATVGMVALRHFLAAHGLPRPPLVATVVGIALNAGLNWLVLAGVFGPPGSGLVGIAATTALVQWLMLLAVVVYTVRHPRFRTLRLLDRFWVPDWPRYREILSLGLPIAFTILSETLLFVSLTLIVGAVQPAALAGHIIVNQLASISFMIPLGVSQAVMVRVGLAAGAGRPDAIRRAAGAAMVLAVGYAILPAGLLLFMPETLIALYLPADDGASAVAARWAATLMIFGIGMILVDSPQVVGHGVLRGLKDTRVPLAITVFSYWLTSLPLAYFLAAGLGWGAQGTWVGIIFGLSLAGVLLCLRCWWRFRVAVPPSGDAAH